MTIRRIGRLVIYYPHAIGFAGNLPFPNRSAITNTPPRDEIIEGLERPKQEHERIPRSDSYYVSRLPKEFYKTLGHVCLDNRHALIGFSTRLHSGEPAPE